MKLSVKGLALGVALLWGICFFLVALFNLWTGYGQEFLGVMSSIYPGYDPTQSFLEVIVGTLYALVDGAIGGALIAWFYNLFAGGQ